MSDTYESSVLNATDIRRRGHEAARRYGSNHRGSSMHGWELGRIAEEGARDSMHGGNLQNGSLQNGSWEAGYIYVLRADGELVSSRYRVVGQDGDPDDILSTGHYELEPMSDHRMSDLDRKNFGDYEIVDRDDTGVRFELQRNFQIDAPTKGAELTAAISRINTLPRSLDNSAHRKAVVARERRRRWVRTKRILGSMLALCVVAVPVVLFTPLIAYGIGTLSPNRIALHTLAWRGEKSAGDLMELLAILLAAMIVGLGAMGFMFPYRDDEEVVSSPAAVGFVLGLVLLLVQAFTGTGGEYSWIWPPLFAVIGHLSLGVMRANQ